MDYKVFSQARDIEAIIDNVSGEVVPESSFDEKLDDLYCHLAEVPDDADADYANSVFESFFEVAIELSNSDDVIEFASNECLYPFFLRYLSVEYADDLELYGNVLELFNTIFVNDVRIPLLPLIDSGFCDIICESIESDCPIAVKKKILSVMYNMTFHEDEINDIIKEKYKFKEVIKSHPQLLCYYPLLCLEKPPPHFDTPKMFKIVQKNLERYASVRDGERFDEAKADIVNSCFLAMIRMISAIIDEDRGSDERPRDENEDKMKKMEELKEILNGMELSPLLAHVSCAISSSSELQLTALRLLYVMSRYEEKTKDDTKTVNWIEHLYNNENFDIRDLIRFMAILDGDIERECTDLACRILLSYFKTVDASDRIINVINYCSVEGEKADFVKYMEDMLTNAPFELRIVVADIIYTLFDEKPMLVSRTMIQQEDIIISVMDLLDSQDKGLIERALRILIKIVKQAEKIGAMKFVLEELHRDSALMDRLDEIEEEEAKEMGVEDLITRLLSMIEEAEQNL